MLDVEDVRLAVYDAFRRGGLAGGPVTAESLAATLDAGLENVRGALTALDESRDVVLGSGGDGFQILMAHPFTAVPLGFSVMGTSHLWWGGCAWDSFAIPHLLREEPEVLVATTCPGCGAALSWVVGASGPPAGDEVAHFLTPAAHIWDDVVRSCGHQRLYCSEDCVARWLARHDRPRGYVMDLATLWRLAQGWYAGRLERGYRRREPAQAAGYFREVGLHGPFWGLPEESDLRE